jgi:cytidine deaminase
MTVDIKKLLKLATAARDNAYAPYSNHPVGVALVTDTGKVFTGCNVETAHYKAVCAEASAISAMVGAGEHMIRTVVVIGPGDDTICTPCGDCRQRLHEFSDAKTRIHSLRADGGRGRVHKMKDLLPDAFGPENLLGTTGKRMKKTK